VVEALCYKPEGHAFENLIFPIYLILPAALDPGVYSASNRNEYQKQKKMFIGSRVRPVCEVDTLTAICESIV
jgi:hypothetical protein